MSTIVVARRRVARSLQAPKNRVLVDLVLDRQTVTVPAEPAQHVAALHRPVPRYDVLQRRRHQVAVVRQTRRERRAVIEDVRLLVARVLERLAEQVAAPPELENRMFHRDEVEDARRGFSRFGHGRQSVGRLAKVRILCPFGVHGTEDVAFFSSQWVHYLIVGADGRSIRGLQNADP